MLHRHNGSLWLVVVVMWVAECAAVYSGQRSITTSGMLPHNSSDACKVFCNPKILHTVQMSLIFNDSKHFVDMKLKKSPEEVERRFTDFLSETKNNPSKNEVRKFVEENFEESGTEFVTWNPGDWKPQPQFINDVYDMSLKKWIQKVIVRWKTLGRKLSSDVRANGDLYSHIYIPNPFIIPGGRFTELYYWDSYWIIEGLLLCEMYDTAKGMIQNFLYLVNKFGYVPNGTRKYYIGRSQPPFLTSMVNLYWKYTKDLTFLSEAVGSLEKEYRFWQENRSVIVNIDNKKYQLFLYNVTSSEHRPESYYHDEMLVKGFSQEDKVRVFSGLKSAAESGWDFSSRWFLDNGERTESLTDINTMSVAPVCLNSLMGLSAHLLSQFFELLDNKSKSETYKSLAKEINTTLSRVFWSDRDGVWMDYNLVKKELIPGFYASNLMPLWTDTYGMERSPKFVVEQVIAYLDRNNITSFPGGIPTSRLNSSEQWDLPFGWAPLQYFIVLGLHKAGRHNLRAEDLAFSFAREWVLNVYQTYLNLIPHELLEKYKVTEVGTSGEEASIPHRLVLVGLMEDNEVPSLYGHKIKTRQIFDAVPLTIGVILLVVSLISVVCYIHRTKVFKKGRWGEDMVEEDERTIFVP